MLVGTGLLLLLASGVIVAVGYTALKSKFLPTKNLWIHFDVTKPDSKDFLKKMKNSEFSAPLKVKPSSEPSGN